jgi:hypothetical protein
MEKLMVYNIPETQDVLNSVSERMKTLTVWNPNSRKLMNRTNLHQFDLCRTKVGGGGMILQE